MGEEQFYTLKGYSAKNEGELSPAMEDYLEMITRAALAEEFVRVNALAGLLNVTPPSSSRMVAKLREQGLVDFERYGIIRLTPKGRQTGLYLLHRHDVLQRFFQAVNGTRDELELVEKIEHFIDKKTISNLERLLPLLAGTCRPDGAAHELPIPQTDDIIE